MKLTWKDLYTSVLAVIGGVVVFAALQGYNWWLIDSWRGALGVLGFIGVLMSVPYIKRIFLVENFTDLFTLAMWLATATVTITGLFVDTTKVNFVTAAIMIGITWLTILVEDIWGSLHHPTHPPLQPMAH